ncbi:MULTISPECIES: hypothetical protein [unclassified Delftia]|uniref:hypothetical protein n=1 Tax=unclassified Delftia TaxID=2613839 RepID=UPI001901D571|nr:MULTISPECIES: hypothetical protein [unclassified Delftia]MBK0111253.1 hypothetical protein [Delftia sp. S65]MBK0116977.1 hypothetical protein [Delftia sp. S67]MBK0128428.1 hypothetical protein [Delftia sp. S66]
MKKLLFLIGCFFIVVTLGLPDGVNVQSGVKSSPFYFIYWLALSFLDFFGKWGGVFWGVAFIIFAILIGNKKKKSQHDGNKN